MFMNFYYPAAYSCFLRGSVECVFHSIVVYAPAGGSVKQVTHHSRYVSCFRCTKVGLSGNRRIIFCSNVGRCRKDTDFRAHSQEEHQTGVLHFGRYRMDSILLLPVISVRLWLTKHSMFIWRTAGSNNVAPAECHQIRLVNDRLTAVRTHMPCDFQQAFRSFNERLLNFVKFCYI